MTDIVPGVQLPVDGTGKIMGDFPVEVATASGPQIVHVPATVIVDAAGYEIGTKLLKAIDELKLAVLASAVEPETAGVF